MLHIDLVCDAELRPRLRLLQQHVQTLGVDLHLHTEIPTDLPPVLIIAPVPDSSLKLDTLQGAGAEIIGLYLERQPPACAAAYEVHIPSWPARSSDPDVEALARYLTAPHVEKKLQEARRQRQMRSRRRRKLSRNLVVLLVLVLLFAGLTQLELNENKPVDDPASEPGESRAQVPAEPLVPLPAETQLPLPAESEVPLDTLDQPYDQADEIDLPPAQPETGRTAQATDASANQIDVSTARTKALDNSRVDSSLDWITAPCQVDETQADTLKQALAHSCVACRSIQP